MSHNLLRRAEACTDVSVAGLAASGARCIENISAISNKTGEGVHPFYHHERCSTQALRAGLTLQWLTKEAPEARSIEMAIAESPTSHGYGVQPLLKPSKSALPQAGEDPGEGNSELHAEVRMDYRAA